MQNRTPQQAVKDALDSGAVAAFAGGKSVDWRFDREGETWSTYSMEKQEIRGCWKTPPFAAEQFFWRPTPLSFPEPPPSERYHNPDNLTPEQVGDGYRLLLVSELRKRPLNEGIERWMGSGNWDNSCWEGSGKESCYRVHASTPFHWDRPVRVPRPATDFIGAWLKIGDEYVAVEGVFPDFHSPIKASGLRWNISELIERNILIRLANTTEFVPCYIETQP